ncbi:hypothetical protein EHQ94_01870 [Leptospira meyeri]|uniref:type I restriction enzyme HsdR N-terminal domain-containing protein n=1 Tax=Leptospira meyeri TaxID=29508 RepID=UPI001083FC2A|nr:type I restriction enzyme HsdR N-terminal domain-containing protein [Leptospira meyeri]TGM62946.1 hypothetical protein EHQ93_11570 [Leptospira meyeri]TGM73536.1 hypothetical protein EHQ94_01870 [Leptospira meyeri]
MIYDKYKKNIKYATFNGKRVIVDYVKKSFVEITPEEIVRQVFLQYLVSEIKVPLRMIEVEVNLGRYVENTKLRADILIFHKKNKERYECICVIETKAPHITLTDEVHQQVFEYSDMLNTKFSIVTNGNETIAYVYKNKKQNQLKNVPTFLEMISKKDFKEYYFTDFQVLQKYTQDELIKNKKAYLDDFSCIGERTPERLHNIILILHNLLINTFDKSNIKFNTLKLSETDIRFSEYGNHTGGGYPGYYRYFLIEYKNIEYIVSLSIFGVFHNIEKKDPRYSIGGYTSLLVAIDGFDTSHNSLQLRLDNNLLEFEDHYKIYHDGKINIGKIGTAPKSELYKFIQKQTQLLEFKEGKIYLGMIPKLENLCLANISHLIENLIIYGIERDNFRIYWKKIKSGLLKNGV